MQNDPELISRTEHEMQQLEEDMEKLKLAIQSHTCNGDGQ